MADDARLQVVLEAKIDKLIDNLNKAEAKLGSFSRAAYGSADQVRKAFDLTQSRLDGPLKLLDLQNKLSIAQAAGNKSQIRSISEEILLLEQVNRLRKLGVAETEAQALAQAHVTAVTAATAALRARGEGLGAAGRAIFDRSRLAVVEEGSAQLRVFGGALEPLGAAGLAAAGGVAALALALERAHNAAEFAEGIQNAAKAAHVTTDALQEYRFALGEAGGQEAEADGALQAFSATLGKAKEGLGKASQAFHALGFSPADVKGFHDTGAALDAVIERIAQLKDTSQKDAIIDQLGLRGLAPLINAGVERIKELKAEAVSAGVVMDASLIERGAAANREFEKLSKIVDIQLKSAFIDLAPALTALLTIAAKFARTIADIVDGLREVDHRSDRGVRSSIDELRARQLKYLQEPGALAASLKDSPGVGHAINQMGAEIARREQLLSGRETARNAAADQGGTRDLIPKAGAAHHGPDVAKNSADALALAQEQLDAALKAELAARLEITHDLGERARLEGQQLAIERDAQKAAIDKREADLKSAVAHKQITEAAYTEALARLEASRLAQDHVVALKQEAIDDQLRLDVQAQNIAQRQAVAGYESQAAQIAEALARTWEERRAIALRTLAADQRLERATLEATIAAEHLDPSAAAERRAALGDAQAAQRSQVQHDNLGPIGSELDKIPKTAAEIKDAFENVAVSGVHSLSDAILGLIDHTQSLGDAFRNVAKSIISDLLKVELQMLVERPLLNALNSAFGFGGGGIGGLGGGVKIGPIGANADGTDNWRGGLSLVGERGPELLNVPRGGQVIPNNVLRSLSSPGVRARPQGPTMIAGPTYVLNSPVVTEDLLSQMNAISARHSANAVAQVNRGFESRMDRYQKLGS